MSSYITSYECPSYILKAKLIINATLGRIFRRETSFFIARNVSKELPNAKTQDKYLGLFPVKSLQKSSIETVKNGSKDVYPIHI